MVFTCPAEITGIELTVTMAFVPKLVPRQPATVPLSFTLVILYVVVLDGLTLMVALLDIPLKVNVLEPSL
jgi:hypothetical protein